MLPVSFITEAKKKIFSPNGKLEKDLKIWKFLITAANKLYFETRETTKLEQKTSQVSILSFN